MEWGKGALDGSDFHGLASVLMGLCPNPWGAPGARARRRHGVAQSSRSCSLREARTCSGSHDRAPRGPVQPTSIRSIGMARAAPLGSVRPMLPSRSRRTTTPGIQRPADWRRNRTCSPGETPSRCRPEWSTTLAAARREVRAATRFGAGVVVAFGGGRVRAAWPFGAGVAAGVRVWLVWRLGAEFVAAGVRVRAVWRFGAGVAAGAGVGAASLEGRRPWPFGAGVVLVAGVDPPFAAGASLPVPEPGPAALVFLAVFALPLLTFATRLTRNRSASAGSRSRSDRRPRTPPRSASPSRPRSRKARWRSPSRAGRRRSPRWR